MLYGGHVIDSALVKQMTKGEQDGAEEWWYGLGTGGWVQDGQTFLGHDGDILTYHGNLVMATADNVSIAVMVPAPANNVVTAEVATFEVPDLLLEALRQR
jgi:hypothetical protein